MIRIVDTHAHLADESFRDDLEEVLARSRDAGVERIIAVGETIEDAERTLELSREYPDVVRAAAGLFPTILDRQHAARVTSWIRAHASEIVAIGEVGLDLWKVQDGAGRALQREIFAGFVDLALELDLPLNVHSRSAGRQAIELLLERGARRVQMHAFDGRAAKALPGIHSQPLFLFQCQIPRW